MVPTPDDAVVEPNSPCIPLRSKLQPFVCSFGAVKTDTFKPTTTVALVGDSHAAHWRAALDPIAQLRGWAGLSLTRSSCPYSTTTPMLAERDTQEACKRWNKDVPRWFKRHKEVSTVFMSHHIQVRVVGAKGAKNQFEAKVKGYMRKWARPAADRQADRRDQGHAARDRQHRGLRQQGLVQEAAGGQQVRGPDAVRGPEGPGGRGRPAA